MDRVTVKFADRWKVFDVTSKLFTFQVELETLFHVKNKLLNPTKVYVWHLTNNYFLKEKNCKRFVLNYKVTLFKKNALFS